MKENPMTDLNSTLITVTGALDDFLYAYILVFLLAFCALYFTVRTCGIQFRYIKDRCTQLTEKRHVNGAKSISSFQAMMVSTASRVGTDNIAGIATTIALGGPSAIFWMWIMAFLGGASAFVESTLAQLWKVRGKDGEFRGDPAYYIEQALGQRWFGIVFAVLFIVCYAYGFNGLQAYNMTSTLEYYVPDYATNGTAVALGIMLMVMTAFVFFGRAKRISVISSIIVPIRAVGFSLLFVFCLTVLVAIMVGCLNNFTLTSNFADITMAFMAIVNLIAILFLGKWTFRALDDYTQQRRTSKDPVFVVSSIHGLPATECWHVNQSYLETAGSQPVKEYLEEAFDLEGDDVGLR